MPHFTLQIGAQGAIMAALIGVSEGRRNALIAQSQALPALVPVSALVDTGASCTCISTSFCFKST